VTTRFENAIAAIDAANADDPFTITYVMDGVEVTRPKELGHSELMCEWVKRLDPDADDAQLLAARAHHLRRWTLPRSDYPEGRAGYLKWRTDARKRHAALVGEILIEVGYGADDDDTIERVQSLVSKHGLGKGGLADVDGRSPAVQVHEDSLCLVFLQTQFVPVAAQLGDEKTIDVLVRTVPKMGPRGQAAALALDLDPHCASLVAAALERLAAAP
jgi:hypothetical protein